MSNKAVAVAVMVLLAFLAGGGAGWLAKGSCAKAEARSVSVGRELEKASFAANSLRTMAEQPTVAKELQELQLRSAVARLDKLTEASVDFDIPIPNLLSGLRRAEEYAASNGLTETAQQARRIIERLHRMRAV